MQKQTPQVTEL